MRYSKTDHLRAVVAVSLRRIADDKPGRPLGARDAAARDAVAAARGDLKRLIERLSDPDPVDPRGLEMTLDLLRDGAGPLYSRQNPDDLGVRLREALAALEPGDERPISAGS
jgi:hypothetical protein